jgi:hypothetical protein
LRPVCRKTSETTLTIGPHRLWAGVVGKNPYGRLTAQPLLEGVDVAGLVLQLQIRR